MDFISTHLLSLILFVPALAGLVMLFLPNDEPRLFRIKEGMGHIDIFSDGHAGGHMVHEHDLINRRAQDGA